MLDDRRRVVHPRVALREREHRAAPAYRSRLAEYLD
jgi:hypothetical protein